MARPKTLVEQVAYDLRREELLKLLRECPDEFREELIDSLYTQFCRYCWQPFKSLEICHCYNDE